MDAWMRGRREREEVKDRREGVGWHPYGSAVAIPPHFSPFPFLKRSLSVIFSGKVGLLCVHSLPLSKTTTSLAAARPAKVKKMSDFTNISREKGGRRANDFYCIFKTHHLIHESYLSTYAAFLFQQFIAHTF